MVKIVRESCCVNGVDDPIVAWYDVYDNVEVQRMTRKRAASATGIAMAVPMVSIAALALGIDGPVPIWMGVGAAAGMWAAFGYWIIRKRQRLRRVVWCVKLSKDEVIGYDYARRRITFAWSDVERLEIGGCGLTIVGPHPDLLEITHLFPEFAQVSHRVMHYADRYNVPVFVDGKPWQQIDVYRVFPFLSEDASSPQQGSAAL